MAFGLMTICGPFDRREDMWDILNDIDQDAFPKRHGNSALIRKIQMIFNPGGSMYQDRNRLKRDYPAIYKKCFPEPVKKRHELLRELLENNYGR